MVEQASSKLAHNIVPILFHLCKRIDMQTAFAKNIVTKVQLRLVDCTRKMDQMDSLHMSLILD